MEGIVPLGRLDGQAILDALASSAYAVDRNLRVVAWNRLREEGPQGIPKDKALGRLLEEILPAAGLESTRAAIRQVFETGVPHEETKEIRQGARVFLTRHLPVKDQSTVTHVLSMFEEVTERKQAQEALERQRAFLRQVIDLGPNFIFAKDRQGRFTLVNRAVAEAYGTTVEGLIGKADASFNPQAEEVEAFRRDDLEVMDSLREKIIPEEVMTDANGAKHWLHTVKRPIVGADGKADQVLGVSTDITAYKRAEEQLRQAHKLEAVGRLAGGVAHDFNNMLSVILGYASMVLPRLPDDELRGKLQEIMKAGERAASLTRQLLAFSRKQILQGKVLDLNAILEDMGKMLGRLIGEDIQLVTVLREGLGRVMADSGQVEQVIMNLALNARDAMPRGGRLTIETANVTLDESYAAQHTEVRPGQYVLLAVTDTGVGMDGETRRHVFEPFFTTKEPGRGTGLGLATVYGIVKQSGGSIEVYSELDHGTTFKIYLPKVDEDVAPAAAAPEKAPPTGSETILFVEDEDALRELGYEILDAHGYKVIAAASAAAALDAAGNHRGPIHLLVTDVVMPGLGGRALSERLAGLHPEAKVLFMSGYTDDAIVRHGILDSAVAFVQKPFTPGVLARKVREVLDDARATTSL